MSVGGRRARIARTVLLADAVAIAVASVAAMTLRDYLGRTTQLAPLRLELAVVAAVVPVWLMILWGLGAYEPHTVTNGMESVGRFLGGSIGGVGAIAVISFAGNLQLSRIYVAAMLVLAAALGSLGRSLLARSLRRLHERGHGITRVLVAGDNGEAQAVADAITQNPWTGYRVAAVVGDEAATNILGAAHENGAQLVVVSPSAFDGGALQRMTMCLEGSPIDLAVAPSLFEVVTRRVSIESVGTLPILHVQQVRIEGVRRAMKRTLDLLVACALALVLLPVAVAAAIAILAESRGPVFFAQRRVGRDGQEFTMWKFRTMRPDAEDHLPDIEHLNEVGHHFFKVRQDPRVTRVGKVLRRWSIDELPQLINVLRGDMSMAGPRPPLPTEVARYEPWHHRRLRARPGITGLWQVSGRSNIPFDEAVRLDVFYIENWSIGLDLRILARTVWAVLGRDGAY